MAGPMTWELAEDLGKELGVVALLTGHPDTLAKRSTESLLMTPAPAYKRGSFARRAFSWVAYCVKAFFWVWQFPKTTPIFKENEPWPGAGQFRAWPRKNPTTNEIIN